MRLTSEINIEDVISYIKEKRISSTQAAAHFGVSYVKLQNMATKRGLKLPISGSRSKGVNVQAALTYMLENKASATEAAAYIGTSYVNLLKKSKRRERKTPSRKHKNK